MANIWDIIKKHGPAVLGGMVAENFSSDIFGPEEYGDRWYTNLGRKSLAPAAGWAAGRITGRRGTRAGLEDLGLGYVGGMIPRAFESEGERDRRKTIYDASKKEAESNLIKNIEENYPNVDIGNLIKKRQNEALMNRYFGQGRNIFNGRGSSGLERVAEIVAPSAIVGGLAYSQLKKEEEEAEKKPTHITNEDFRNYKTAELDLRDEYGPNADNNPDFKKELARLRVRYGLSLEPLEPLEGGIAAVAAEGGYIKKYRFGGSSSDAYAGESTRQEIIDEIFNEGGEPTEPEILRRLELMGLADPDRYARHMRAMADSDIGKFLPNESAAPPVYTSINKSKQRFPVVGSTRRSVLTKRVGPKKGPEYKPTLDDMIGAFRSSGILAHRGGSVSDLSAQSGLGSLYNDNSIGMISGPGGPTSDDIPAMLSDGEFVMTADAVNGAGGPEVMYELMDRFEGRA